jgi:tetratricopeptide (TPR) repeat protein
MNAAAFPPCLEEPAEPGSSTGELTAAANEAFARGDIARVCECLSAALELSPDNGELALALGHAEMSGGNLEAARAAYWSATLLLPKLASAHSCHALAARLLGRKSEASRSAVRAISLDPRDAVGLKVLARIHLDAGQPEAARQACRLVLRRDPQDADANQMLEEVFIQEAKLAENILEKRLTKPLPPRRRFAPPVAVAR